MRIHRRVLRGERNERRSFRECCSAGLDPQTQREMDSRRVPSPKIFAANRFRSRPARGRDENRAAPQYRNCDYPTTGKSVAAGKTCPAPGEKYSDSSVAQISPINRTVPPDTRGGSRSSRTRRGMRWTWQRRARNGIAGQLLRRAVSDRPAHRRTAFVSLSPTLRWTRAIPHRSVW